jgi:hypothetical protein
MKIEPARVPTSETIVGVLLAAVSSPINRAYKDAYKIILDVRYTEEEKYLIEKLGIQDHILFTAERLPSDEPREPIEYKVGYFCKPRVQNRHPLLDDNPKYALLIDAKNALPIIEQSFETLKQLLHSADIPEHRTFEL